MGYSITGNQIEIVAGCDYSDEITLQDPNAQAIDLTGATAVSQIRALDGTLAGTFTTAIPVGTDGRITREILAAATGLIAPGVYSWGVLVTTGAGAVWEEIQGTVKVKKGVVHA